MQSFLAVFAFASITLASRQVPLGRNSVAAAQITGNPSVVDYYNQEFNNLHLANQFRVQNIGGWCSGCDQSPECCPWGGWSVMPNPATTPAPTPATTRTPITTTQPSQCDPSNTPKPPAASTWSKFSLPSTILSANPAWETLLRHPISNTAARARAPAVANLRAASLPSDDTTTTIPEDITSSYYTFTIEGHHPYIIPLILKPTRDTNALTLLATANLQQRHSFISSTLLQHLNLTSQIHTRQPFQTRIFDDSVPVSVRGTIDLDVLAGRHDRSLPSTPFLVFDPAVARETHGLLRPDVVVGMNFLNRAGALRLTDEYVGVGAKEGLGIVVQRVYGSVVKGEEQEEERGEL